MSAFAALMMTSAVGPCLPGTMEFSTSETNIAIRLDDTGTLDLYINASFQSRPYGTNTSNIWGGSQRDFFFDGEHWEARWVGLSGSTGNITVSTTNPGDGVWRQVSNGSTTFYFPVDFSADFGDPNPFTVTFRLEIRDPTTLNVVASSIVTLSVNS